MANNFFDSLKRLFSTQVVVRKVGKNRLKVIDNSQLQSSGNYQNTRIDRFRGVHSSKSINVTGYGNSINFQTARVQLFLDYEGMDTDPLISSALDIYADECVLKNTNGDILEIRTNDEKVKKILHNLFYDILNIDFNLWAWVRNMVKYGDFFMYLDIKEDIGIVNVIPMSSYDTARIEGDNPEDPYEVKFEYNGDRIHGKDKFDFYEVAHFRLLADSNFLPYGKSTLEGARKIFKMLVLMEDALLIHRIMRAPEKRKFLVDIGNIPPDEVDSYMETLANQMKKVPYVDPQTGQYNLKYNIQNMVEDYFLPVRGKDSGTDIQTVDGLKNEGFIDDIEYVRDRMISALKIPKAFLGYEEGTEGGKATLAAQDIRFARTIERLQNFIISELTKVAIIHLYAQGFEGEELVSFDLRMTSPSIVYERQKIELLSQKVELITALKDLNLVSHQYIYENILNMSTDEWKREKDQVIQDQLYDFRISQIQIEGNDPEVTGEALGTPHTLASLHMGVEKEDGRGRPSRLSSFETHKDKDFGRDPIGHKAITSKASYSDGPSKDTSKLSKESLDRSALIRSLKSHYSKSVIIHENNKNKEDISFLDEDKVLN